VLVTASEISECDSVLVKGFEAQGASGGLVIVSAPLTDTEAQSVPALWLWPRRSWNATSLRCWRATACWLLCCYGLPVMSTERLREGASGSQDCEVVMTSRMLGCSGCGCGGAALRRLRRHHGQALWRRWTCAGIVGGPNRGRWTGCRSLGAPHGRRSGGLGGVTGRRCGVGGWTQALVE
jgi:hypothetical protein